ncbi:hypothetical protein [Tateyamaria sp. SN3-11]|uniref:hypothetical protein n=1 Tax=Tateyamaria sp. SN3-11 TaxID=3092147 RepID=UPI0039ED6D52
MTSWSLAAAVLLAGTVSVSLHADGLGVTIVDSSGSFENAEHSLTAEYFSSIPPRKRKEFLARWRNIDVVDQQAKLSDCCSNIETAVSKNPDKSFKVGAPYLMEEVGEPGFIDTVAGSFYFLAFPSEAASRRTVFAFDISRISSEDWETIRKEVGRQESSDFSFLVKTENGYVGTPVKWNTLAADVIAATIEEPENDHRSAQPSEIFIAGMVGETVHWSNVVIGSAHEVGMGIADNGNAIADAIHQQKPNETNALVAFAEIPPTLQGVEPIRLETKKAVSGMVLGSQYPSWPNVDVVSPKSEESSATVD